MLKLGDRVQYVQAEMEFCKKSDSNFLNKADYGTLVYIVPDDRIALFRYIIEFDDYIDSNVESAIANRIPNYKEGHTTACAKEELIPLEEVFFDKDKILEMI